MFSRERVLSDPQFAQSEVNAVSWSWQNDLLSESSTQVRGLVFGVWPKAQSAELDALWA